MGAQVQYGCVDLLLSDHKPVSALFDMRARAYAQDRVEAVLDTARRVVDAREMDARPKCAARPKAPAYLMQRVCTASRYSMQGHQHCLHAKCQDTWRLHSCNSEEAAASALLMFSYMLCDEGSNIAKPMFTLC